MQLVPEVGLDQLGERGDLFWLESADACAAKHLADGAGAQEGEVVPVFEPRVDPVGNGDEGLAAGAFKGAGAEVRGDEVTYDAGVEGISREADAAVGEQLMRAAAR